MKKDMREKELLWYEMIKLESGRAKVIGTEKVKRGEIVCSRGR